MKKPNLNRVIQLQQRNQRLKTFANNLANQLILDFDINDGLRYSPKSRPNYHKIKIELG